MSLRRVDPRFTLPSPPGRVAVLGDLDEWRRGLEAVGLEVVGLDSRRADLVVAPRALARAAASLDTQAVILEGRADRPLARQRFTSRHYLPRPTVYEPALLVPLDQPLAASYAVRRWSIADRSWKRRRRDIAGALLARGRALPLQPTVTVALREPAEPYLVSAAVRELALPVAKQWVLTLGQGDALSRNVFHLFPAGEDAPTTIVKFARVPGYAEPFDHDERGLALAAAAGPAVARRAPRLVGRFTTGGVHASVETAAVGSRLRELLQDRRTRPLACRVIDGVAAWVIELGRASHKPPDALEGERRRLVDEVVPRWRAQGVSESLVAELPPLPAVTQHNDLGSWNVIVDGLDFTAVDWESARASALPLWDLLYFLADALAVLDGSVRGEERHEHTRRLFRGDLGSSQTLFAWVRRAVDAFRVPPDAVGRIATLCWLHHSLSHVHRGAKLERVRDSTTVRAHGLERTAETWLSDPALGPSWNRWR